MSIGPNGKLAWEDGTSKVYDTDPDSGWFERMLVRIGSWLPIDWMLSSSAGLYHEAQPTECPNVDRLRLGFSYDGLQ